MIVCNSGSSNTSIKYFSFSPFLAIQLADVDVKIHSKKKPTASQAAQSQNTITKWPPMTKNNNNNADDIGTILSNIALRDDHR